MCSVTPQRSREDAATMALQKLMENVQTDATAVCQNGYHHYVLMVTHASNGYLCHAL